MRADQEFVLAAMRLEPFVFQWAAAGLLQTDDFVEQAVPMLYGQCGTNHAVRRGSKTQKHARASYIQ